MAAQSTCGPVLPASGYWRGAVQVSGPLSQLPSGGSTDSVKRAVPIAEPCLGILPASVRWRLELSSITVREKERLLSLILTSVKVSLERLPPVLPGAHM